MERSNADIFSLVDGLRARGVSKFSENGLVIELLPFAPGEVVKQDVFSTDWSSEGNKTVALDDAEVAAMLVDVYNDTVRGGEE